MKQMGICKRVKWLTMNQPLTLPSIINDSRFDKRIFIGILHDLIPRRTSIEIECINKLTDHISNIGKPKESLHKGYNSESYPKVANLYNIRELVIDKRNMTSYTDSSIILRRCDYDEHNISITNYTQLIGLYKILQDMQKHCLLNTASGCHIHLDISKTIKLPNYNPNSLNAFFTNKCKNGTIDSIFGKYNGTMMTCKLCTKDNKSAWITTRSDLKSIEFRTPPMTFDYSTIVKWFIAVNKLLNEYEYSIQHKEQSTESPKELLDKKNVTQTMIDEAIQRYIHYNGLTEVNQFCVTR